MRTFILSFFVLCGLFSTQAQNLSDSLRVSPLPACKTATFQQTQLPLQNTQQWLNLQEGWLDNAYLSKRSADNEMFYEGIQLDGYNGTSAYLPELFFVGGVENGTHLKGSCMAEHKLQAIGTIQGGDFLTRKTELFDELEQINPISEVNAQIQVQGMLLPKKLGVQALIRVDKNEGYLYGQRFFSTESVGLSPFGQYAYLPDRKGDDSWTSMNDNSRFSYGGKLNYQINHNQVIEAFLSGDNNQFQSYNHFLKFNPDAQTHNRFQNRLAYLRFKHTNKQHEFTLTLSHFTQQNQSALYEDPLDTRYRPRYYYGITDRNQFSNFSIGGTDNFRYKQTFQQNQIQAQYRYQKNAHRLQINANFSKKPFNNAFSLTDSAPFDTQNLYETVLEDSTFSPIEANFALNYKLSKKSVSIESHLIAKGFNAKSKTFSSPTNPCILYRNCSLIDTKMQMAWGTGLKIEVLPNDKHQLKLEAQINPILPTYSDIFLNYTYQIGGIDNLTVVGNQNPLYRHYFESDITHTYFFRPNLKIETQLYHLQSSDLPATNQIFRVEGTSVYYTQLGNGSNLDRTGILLTGTFTHKHLQTALQYRYENQQSNSSSPEELLSFVATYSVPEETALQFGKEYLHLIRTYGTFDKNGWILGWLGHFRTGDFYTPSLPNPNSPIATLPLTAKPSRYNLDVKLAKRFNKTYQLGIFVQNLLDNLQTYGVYTDTGTASYSLYKPLEARNFTGNPRFLDEQYSRPDFYAPPRRVLFELQIRL